MKITAIKINKPNLMRKYIGKLNSYNGYNGHMTRKFPQSLKLLL